MKRLLLPVLFVAAAVAGGVYWYTSSGTGSAPSPAVEQRLTLARTLLDNNQPEKALAVVDELAKGGARLGEAAQFVRVQALSAAGNAEQAQIASTEFLRAFPKSEHAADAEQIQLKSKVLAGGADDPELLKRADAALRTNPNGSGAVALEAALGIREVKEGRVDEATARFERLWQTAPDDAKTRELAEVISRANLDSLYAGRIAKPETHKVARGEALFNIARRNKVTPELMLRANGITDPKRLRIGQELKIPDTNWSLVADVSGNALKLYNHGKLFRFYTVRTGRELGTTPQGEFRILNKKANPTWRPGDGRVYLPGDPNNELGTRWMAFEGDILGIHGTLHPETLGHYASNGCIGMAQADVEELFDLITEGTPLKIVGEQDPTRHNIIPARDVPPPMQVARN